MDNNWNIIQRLVRIDVCSKSVNAHELAQVLNQCLSVDYEVRANSFLAAMRDSASVKQAALDRITFIFPKMLNVVCFSHTLDNVGNHLVIPTLVEFGSLWIRMFRHSCKAKLLWKDVTGQTPRSYSETRWWSKWGVSSVWRCRKVRRRGKGPKSLPTATATTSSNTFWLTVTNELEAWACRHYWCWRTFCESHVFFGRGWSFGCCLLWEIKRCFLILSSSLFP